MATALAPPLGPSLATPQPHYLPGYRGHCPRYKFALGQTYGKLTSQLLADPEGVRPGQPLLQPIWCPHGPLDHPEEEGAGKGRGADASLFGGRTIPGYTGFIPRAQNHFAKTYSQICKEAGQEFARQLARGAGGRQARQVLLTPRDVKPELEVPPRLEEQPRLATSPYASARRVPPSSALKPHREPAAAAEDSHPQKYFISGFTGFVPRARYLIGAGYPTLTQRAWAEFRQMLQKAQREAALEGSAQRKRDGQAFPPLVMTYPTDKGLLPHYQGYVPGYKFQFGRTYGHLTYDALGRSTPEKRMPDRLP